MLVHDPDEVVPQWLLGKQRNQVADCLMDVSWAFCWSSLSRDPSALVCGSASATHFPRGGHLLYLMHPHLGGFQSCDGYF